MNGHSHRSPSFTPNTKPPTPITFKIPRRDVPFSESPAIVRTPGGMVKFSQLESQQAGPSNLSLVKQLQELSPPVAVKSEAGHEWSLSPDDMIVDDIVGEKRKL